MRVIIVDYKEEWKQKFLKEKNIISDLLSFLIPVPIIEHIGSTSVPGLGAKTTIDILIGLDNYEQLDQTIETMATEYTFIKKYNPLWPTRRFYCRYMRDNNPPSGYSNNSPIPVIIDEHDPFPKDMGLISLTNIHTIVKNSDEWLRHIAFRDYLIAFPEIKKQYHQLKLDLS